MKVLLCLLICRCFTSLFALYPSQPVWYAKYSGKGLAARIVGEAFFDIPVNKREALNQGWVVAETNDHETVLCLPGDPRVGIICGNDGLVAGVDIGIPVADLTSPYMVKDHPEFFNTTRLGQDVVVSRMYFVNPAVLRKGGRQHLHGGVLSELWLKEGNGSINIPTNEAVLEQTTLFKRDLCDPSMGRQYHYNISAELSCMYYKPWSLHFDDFTAELIGCGFQMFGNPSYHMKKWNESFTPEAVKIAIPNSPDCFEEWEDNYNLNAVHLYSGACRGRYPVTTRSDVSFTVTHTDVNKEL